MLVNYSDSTHTIFGAREFGLIAVPSTRTDFAGQLDTALQAACEPVVYQNADPKASLDQAADEFAKAIKQ